MILLFATPALCKSRVCGPVTDVAEEVKAEYGDRADFIHMEIYKDNDPNKGLRPQVRAWGSEDRAVPLRDRPPRADRGPARRRLQRGGAGGRRAQGTALSGFERGVLLTVAAIIALAVVLDRQDTGSHEPAGDAGERGRPPVCTQADVARIARRVERIRGLRFRRPVRPLFVDRERAVRRCCVEGTERGVHAGRAAGGRGDR